MANIDTNDRHDEFYVIKRHALQTGRVQRTKVMLVAAGLASFGIVAVAAAMMTTLL